MGLDLGFEMEGFDIRVTLDVDPCSCDTLRVNRPNIPLIARDIRNVTTEDILEKAKLRLGEATVITGGPPCQPFSTAGRRLSINDKKGVLVFEFLRVIREARPEFFVFENVSGLLSAALKHMAFYERISKKEKEIPPDMRLGTAFEVILERFKTTEYQISWDVLNAADYGVPQKRKRLIMIGSRDEPKPPLPKATHAPKESLDVITGLKKPWVTLREALSGLNDPDPEHVPFPSWGKYMKYIPPGGYWRDLPEELKKEAMGGAYYSQGGRTGFYRRLSWDKPSPTLVTSPVFKGTCLAHPEEPRPLSVREYARIQGFPDQWKSVGPTKDKYRLIGEAVPIQLSRAIAKVIKCQI